MKRLYGIAGLLFVLCSTAAHAATVKFESTNLSDSLWQYDFSILNDSSSYSIEEFTIFFEETYYSSLAVVSSPAGWDSIVIQPDTAIPDEGFVDSLAFSSPLEPGSFLEGLSVSFIWLGAGAPGSQLFEIINPGTFAIIEAGTTIPTPVPLPAAFWLFLAGAGCINLMTWRRSVREVGNEIS